MSILSNKKNNQYQKLLIKDLEIELQGISEENLEIVCGGVIDDDLVLEDCSWPGDWHRFECFGYEIPPVVVPDPIPDTGPKPDLEPTWNRNIKAYE